jgi:pimeloyl-ACP methyl ester carboxylesterase
MPFIKVQNKELFYDFIYPHLLNSGKPLLVFLHEGLGCSEQWKDFHINLAGKLNLPGFYYDRYGYGKSQEIKETRDIHFLEYEAEVVLNELFEKIGLKKNPKILFGHSDGASIALLYAAKFPDEVIGVITEAAHVINEKITSDGQKEVIELFRTTDLKNKLSRYHGDKTESMFNAWINVWQSEEMKTWSLEHLLGTITCPILALQGADDQYGSPEQLARIKKHAHRTSVTTVLIPDCGHIPHHQAREEVEKLTLKFIGELAFLTNH